MIKYPLSKTEEGIYVSCLKKTDAYNLANVINLGADVDIARFKNALKDVFMAHQYLFTILYEDDEKIYKRIEKTDIKLDIINSDILNIEPEYFDLLNKHLFSLRLYLVGGEYFFYFNFHHIIFDGFSINLFINELFMAYDGKKLNKEVYDANMYSLDELNELSSDKYKDSHDFFINNIKDPEVDSTIIYDKNDGEVKYKSFVSKLNIKNSDIKKITKKYDIKTSSYFLSAFSYLLTRINNDDKALFLTVNNGRNEKLKNSMGMFVKTYPFYLENTLSVKELLESANSYQVNAISNLLYPFSSLYQELGFSANIIFAYQGDYFYKSTINGKEIDAKPLSRIDGKENIAIELHRDNNEFIIWVEYRSDLYNDDTISHLVSLFDLVLHEFLNKELLSDINLVSGDELKILDSFNNHIDLSFVDMNKTILDYYYEAKDKYLNKNLVVFKDRKYTYKDVDEITNGLALKLISLGIKKECVTSILIHKSEYILIASLGVIKSGGAYQPLDPTYPKDRLNFMVSDSKASILILDRDLDDLIDDFKGYKIYTDEINSLRTENKVDTKISGKDLFIMLYTSGTTGLPKGVMLDYKNITTFSRFFINKYDMNETSSIAAYASYGFDADMMDLYPALISGATIHVIPEELRLDLIKLGDYYNNNNITHGLITTQVGRQVVENIELKTMKHLFVGGEKLVPIDKPNGYILHNAYGPTEGTVYCNEKEVDRLYYRVPIGKSIDTYKMYVLDKNMNRLPYLVAGELYISGPQVARGYLNREEENKKAFINNPFDNDPLFKNMYKTGDIVRFLPDGTVDFIGRKDSQVKIRGFRVELTEVEKVIREYDGIKDATVKDFLDPAGVKFICAYIVSDKKIDIDDLNKFIASKKPPYMVPQYTMQLDKIPLNQNQKVNKRALPMPEMKDVEIVEAKTKEEKELFDMISDILGHKSFGITTNLYDAGLTSVSTIRLNVKLAKYFNCDVSSSDIIQAGNIKGLIELFSNKDKDISYDIREFYPITKTQEGIFAECVKVGSSTNYNIPYLFKLPKSINLNKLESSIIKAIDNHPYIKTTLFISNDGEILSRREDTKTIVDVINTPSIDIDSLVRPFEIIDGKLYRIEIYVTNESNYLFLDFHHIICDGTSEAIILNDINNAYLDKELEKEDFTGFDISLMEKDLLKSNKYIKAKEFYSNALANIDGEYLIKKDLKVSELSRLESKDFIIDLDNIKLDKYIKDNKLTNNAYFNFAFAFTLSKYLYKNDVLYTTIYNGRNSSKLINTVSMLVKTLPVYISYDESDLILDKINNTKDLLSNLAINDIYSFEEVARDFDINADIMFAYQGDNFIFDKLGGNSVDAILLESNTPKSAFSIDVFLENNKYRLHFEWDRSYYNIDTINSFERLFSLTLNELMIKKYVKEINTLPEFDKELYEKFNATEEEIPNISFNKLVEGQAILKENHTAVIGCDKSYKYKEFNEAANKVANYLISSGVKLESRVIMLMPRIADAYVVRQGIIKSGGAFVPIDPKYPLDRIEYIILNSEAKILISTKDIIKEKEELINKTGILAISIEDILKSNDINNPNINIPQSSLCYIIYTSGSTGRPKGVMISHKNLVNYTLDGKNLATTPYREIEGEGIDVVGCSFASLSFDASLQEECIPLSHGYTAVIASEEEIENPLLLAKTLIKNHVNIMFMTPSFVSNFIDMPEFIEALKGFKVLDMGAEAVPSELCEKLRSLGIMATIYNGYGPTETTITSTYHKVLDKYMTIGKPFSNTKLYLLDKAGHILPINAIGDLTIAGDAVGIGYLGLADKTNEKFITINGLRAYRSGDLARYNSEGNIEFFGRLDNQVKLRGLRVELDEIERVLNKYPNISRSIIVVKTNNVDGDYLAAYYTSPKEIDKDDLTKHLAKSLTPYMVPKVLMQLDKIPLTPNGKIDKKALPEVELKEEKKNIKKPTNKLEDTLVEIFKKALGKKEVGIDEDFFDLGGTSLSASKIAMLAIQKNLPIAYKDIFDYSTVLELEEYINSKTGKKEVEKEESSVELNSLSYNDIKYINDIKEEYEANNIILFGATGFLGIHILKELIDAKKNVIAVVKGTNIDSTSRLKGLLAYYFDSPLDTELEKYVKVIDYDITDENLINIKDEYKFDTIINSAAVVKHFSNDDSIERVNVLGVKNLVTLAKYSKARLIQVSTLSVAGENIDNKFLPSFKMKENMLSFGQDISNKYINSKFKAESIILDEITKGLDAKIIRVGNLMGRQSDGEFQANSITNGFMRDLKAYATMHKFPVNSLDIEIDFSPIDEVAKTILLLMKTNSKFSVFHSANSHMIQMGDVIYTLNELGFNIKIVSDYDFDIALKEMLNDDKKNMIVSSLLSYSNSDSHIHSYIQTDNEFTNKALYHLGYKWPITDTTYLKKALESLISLDFFERNDI